jgi:hypothetical protein
MECRSLWIGLAASLAGLVGGYALGIFAGLWMQRLGWMAVIINMLAFFAGIIVCGTALIILVALVF